MAVPVVMPHMGESVIEGKIVAWLKQPGERVEADEPLVEIATDKINVEVPAPAAGVLLQVLAEAGATVAVDQPIALVGEAGEEVPAAPAQKEPARAKPPTREERETPPPAPPKVEPRKPPPGGMPAPRPAAAPQAEAPGAAPPDGLQPPGPRREGVAPSTGPIELGTLGVLASPAVRRFARERRVDLGKVTGTGRMGRITRGDVDAHLAQPPKGAAPTPAAAGEAAEAPKAPARGAARHPDVDEELIPLTPMRKAIAEHMVRSKREAPHVTTIAEADVTDVAALRERLKDSFAAQGVKLTYMAFLFGAVARALKEYPDLNAQWTDKGILVKYRINLGMAVAVEDGLVVPVIRDADRLPLVELARAIQSLAEKTREGKVAPADLEGGTFTITNPGVFGAVISTPIIHQPQAAILAAGRIADVPAVVNGAIGIRKRFWLSLSYDHRIVDGATAVRFLQRVREVLETADFGPAGVQ